ncbi:serine hydrolase domain-containing protein, partial [Actinoplanes sp. NPDC051633]|uniref:serine hydrolase domain-containing protein n=1 Tax=Actinoplanes sp. NPDC051633 TaxID=3155670 RepID=UPI00341E0B2A
MSSTQNLLPDTPTPAPSNQPLPSVRPASVGRRRIVEAAAGIGVVAAWFVSGYLLGLGFLDLVLLAVPLLAAFHILVRRRPLQTLLVRDTASFAHGWAGKLLVAAVLIAIPATMVLLSLSGPRYGRYADDSWKTLLMLVVLAGTYIASRRLVLTVLVGAVTVAVVSWALSPSLAGVRNGDQMVLAHLDQQERQGTLAGHHDVAVAEVDLNEAQPVRLAGIGADDTTVMEVGSMTKAMTGLVIADAVRRGEIRMDAPVATYLPQLKGSPAGTATLHELVTHTSGYAEFGAATLRRAAWAAPLGRNFLTADSAQMTEETRSQTLDGRGRYAYSTLASAIAGQAVAAAAHMSYPDLMRTRLFEPLGMSHTTIEVDHALVAGGESQTGL